MRKGQLAVSVLVAATAEAFVSSGRGQQSPQPLLAATTRRESFGELLGSSLLPAAAAAPITATPHCANAADEYPFKVCGRRMAAGTVVVSSYSQNAARLVFYRSA